MKPERRAERAPRELGAQWSTANMLRRGLGYAALAFVGACAALPGSSLDVHGDADAVDASAHRDAHR